jgi:hypothetical protein
MHLEKTLKFMQRISERDGGSKSQVFGGIFCQKDDNSIIG